MTQTQLGQGLYTLLFFIAVFFLTSVGLAVLHYGMLASSFWFVFIYIVTWAVLFAFASNFFGGRHTRALSGKKVLVLAIGVMLTAALFTHSVWTIVTPRWSFLVSTDKSTYRLGEPVAITASLRNMGFITHYFTSRISDPVVFGIKYQYGPTGLEVDDVWYSPGLQEDVTEFSVNPNQSLERQFIWNQTRNSIFHTREEIEPGRYNIVGFIPSDSTSMPIWFGDNLFFAWTSINITSA